MQQDEKQKPCQEGHFSTKNSINQPNMNNRLFIAAVFHFEHPVERGELRAFTLTSFEL